MPSDKEDVVESYKRLWSTLPMLGKVGLIMTGLSSVGSWVSVRENIYSWGGTISDMLAFYRDWISGPVITLYARFDISIPQIIFDLAVIFLMYAAAAFRMYRWLGLHPSEQRNAKWEDTADRIMNSMFTISIVGVLIGVVVFGASEAVGIVLAFFLDVNVPDLMRTLSAMPVAFAVSVFWAFILARSLFWVVEHHFYVPRHVLLMGYTPVVYSFVFVFFLSLFDGLYQS